jgi:hypothetical protein
MTVVHVLVNISKTTFLTLYSMTVKHFTYLLLNNNLVYHHLFNNFIIFKEFYNNKINEHCFIFIIPRTVKNILILLRKY